MLRTQSAGTSEQWLFTGKRAASQSQYAGTSGRARKDCGSAAAQCGKVLPYRLRLIEFSFEASPRRVSKTQPQLKAKIKTVSCRKGEAFPSSWRPGSSPRRHITPARLHHQLPRLLQGWGHINLYLAR